MVQFQLLKDYSSRVLETDLVQHTATRQWEEPPMVGTKVKVGDKQEQNQMHQEIVQWGHTLLGTSQTTYPHVRYPKRSSI